ncbi:MAG: RNA polymerase sigma factor [Gammaproteobacteria bacterium]
MGTQDRPEIRSIRAFALSVARNVAFDWLRRGKIVQFDAVADMDALDVNDERPAPDEIVSGEQEFERLVQAVEALPEARRQVFELRKVYGFSVREISVKLDMAERTVERHLQEAIRTLAQLLYGAGRGTVREHADDSQPIPTDVEYK